MKIRLVALFAVLMLLFACYRAAEVSYSTPQENIVQQWMIEFKTTKAEVQLSLRVQRERDGGFNHSSMGFGISPDQLIGLTREQAMSAAGTNVSFQLKRDAGTFNFEGWFKQGNGSGHFTFSPNSSFASELAKQGFGTPTDEQLLSLAMADTGLAFINELKAQGYDTTTVDQLVRMSHHGVRLEYLQGLKSLGYSVKTTDLVVRMKDHGVSLNFIREMTGLGYTNITTEELVRTKDHGVNAAYINEFMNAGYNRATLDEWIRLKDHGVSMTFISELKELGYEPRQRDNWYRLVN